MQCTTSATKFPRRTLFRSIRCFVEAFEVPGFMRLPTVGNFVQQHDHLAGDISRLSTETYNQRLQRCKAVDSGWLQALHLLKRMKARALPPFHLNMGHFPSKSQTF